MPKMFQFHCDCLHCALTGTKHILSTYGVRNDWLCVCAAGGKDLVAAPSDVKLLLDTALQRSTVLAAYEVPSYGHMDFMWGSDAYQLVYPVVLKTLKEGQSGRVPSRT